MPEAPPPDDVVPQAVLLPLAAGTRVWRAHARRHQDSIFNPTPRDPQFTDGRFSGMAPDPFPYCYVGLDRATALMEKYARTIPYSDKGWRAVRRSALRGELLSEYELTHDLTVVGLRTQTELAAVCQDAWLLHAEGHDHAKTRRWGRWIREHTPAAQGLLWPSKRDVGGSAVVLFADRCPADPLRLVAPPVPLLGEHEDELNRLLEPYRVVIPPARVRTRLSPDDEPGTIRA
jgi:hypothetical protein